MKRHNPWNDMAWNTRLLKKQQYEGFEEQPPHQGQQRYDGYVADQSRLQNHQMRAEFFDFDSTGLKKFQNSKKYIQPTPAPQPSPFGGFEFNQNPENAAFSADFLNWDGSAPSNKQPSHQDPFAGFDFGSAGNHGVTNSASSSFFPGDIFGTSGSQNPISAGSSLGNAQSSNQATQFWDPFGGPDEPQNASSTHKSTSGQVSQTSPFPSASPSPQNPNDLLLQLSLEPEAELSAKGEVSATQTPSKQDEGRPDTPHNTPFQSESKPNTAAANSTPKGPNSALLDLEI